MGFLKESTGDIMRLTRAVDELADRLVIFCGGESLAYESFVMGAKAWVCVLANVAPAQSARLYDLIVNQGKLEEARALYRQILPLLRLTEETGELWQIVKYILKQRGFGTGTLRLPRQPISEGVKAQLRRTARQGRLRLKSPEWGALPDRPGRLQPPGAPPEGPRAGLETARQASRR